MTGETGEVRGDALPSRALRVAAAQDRARAGDVAANAATVATRVREAARAGARVVVFPEKFLSGYEPELIRADPRNCAVHDWRLGLGLGICYDSGFPEHARAAALDGCHAYLVGALFGVGNGHHESRTWFPARALEAERMLSDLRAAAPRGPRARHRLA